jgi:serine/threonine-protein kinase
MPLEKGTRLGLYELSSLIGAGAMGEVYRARDTKLRREVAVKVLPASFARDPERLARFQREARFLASLNHPGIATLHGLEDDAGTHFLVMELVLGETLADRFSQGPLAFAEALPLLRQIAEALEAAHAGGVVHRDLKPANIKVTPDGKVKILDFGLAKGFAEEAVDSDLSQSPTLTRDATRAGVIFGTPSYMSPEQAQGKPVDKRTDIWAFGCVLYEALTGRKAFDGESFADILGRVLHKEPSWEALPPETPWRARDVLGRCLRKDPRERLHDIADARIELDETGPAEAAPHRSVSRRSLPRAAVAALVGIGIGAGITAGIAALTARSGAHAPEVGVSRLAIPLPDDAPLFINTLPGRSLALSPDGAQIVYATANSLPANHFRLRRLDQTDIRSIPGTETGNSPFFSPDGEWLAYFDGMEQALKKISVRGGRAVTLQRGFPNAGWMFGTWCDDGHIVFDTWNGGLRVIDGDGGNPRVLTEPTDEWNLDPQPLPGPCRVLFYTYRADGHAIEAISVNDGERTRILEDASHGRFLASGHLLFVRDGALQLAPFDADRLKVTGPAVPLPLEVVVDEVKYGAPHPQLAVSRNGTLVYAPSDEKAGRESHLVALTRDGQVEELGTLPFFSPALALSPDGERLALAGRRAGQASIEALDLRRRASTSLVDLGAADMPAQPVWAPDGRSLLYARYGPVEGEIVRHVLDGSVADQVLCACRARTSAPGRSHPTAVSSCSRAIFRGPPATSCSSTSKRRPAPNRSSPSSRPRFGPSGRHLPGRRVVRLLLERVRARRDPHREVPGAWTKDVGVERSLRRPGLVARWEGALLHGARHTGKRRARHDGRSYRRHARLARERATAAVLRSVRDRGGRHGSRFRHRAGRPPLPASAKSTWRVRMGFVPQVGNSTTRGAELVHRAAPERGRKHPMTVRRRERRDFRLDQSAKT